MVLALAIMLLAVNSILAGEMTIDCSKKDAGIKLFTCESDTEQPDEDAVLCHKIRESFSRIRCVGVKATHCVFLASKTETLRMDPGTYDQRPDKELECPPQWDGATSKLTAKYTSLAKDPNMANYLKFVKKAVNKGT